MAWRVIPDSPERASYLTRREKLIARHRLFDAGHEKGKRVPSDDTDDDDDGSEDMYSDTLTRCCQSACEVLLDPIPWTTAAIFFLTNVAYSSLPVFLPSILTQMHHTPLAAQALAAPPYLVSFVVVLAAAKTSDALQSRAYLIAAAALASALGYAFLAAAHTLSGAFGLGGMDLPRYLAVYPAAVGFFCVVVLTIAWNVNNSRRGSHRGGAFALMQVFGQCGPLVGTRLYPRTDGPWFSSGMGVCAGCMFGVAALALGLRWHLARANRRMDRESEEGGGEEGEGLVVGRRSLRFSKGNHGFRYML